jgi:hypothetical protein
MKDVYIKRLSELKQQTKIARHCLETFANMRSLLKTNHSRLTMRDRFATLKRCRTAFRTIIFCLSLLLIVQ